MSVRLRLTVWYSTILAIVVVGFAAASYGVIARASLAAIDASLETTSRAFAVELAAEDLVGGVKPVDPDEDDEHEALSRLETDPRAWERATIAEITAELPFPQFDLEVLDDAGVVLASRGAFPGDAADGTPIRHPQLRELVDKAGVSGMAVASIPAGVSSLRIRADALTFAGRRVTVISARGLDEHEASLARVRRSYALAVPFSVLLASVGGFLLVRKSLAPVAEMGARAEAIGASNLGDRLAVQSDDEFGRLARIFNRMLERIETAFELQRQFMQDASHELRTPVAIVRGEAEVALSRSDRPGDDYRDSLAIVHDEGRRLARIVDDLFLLSRADASQLPIETADFDLGESVADAAQAMRTLAAQRNVKLLHDGGEEMPFRGDERLIGAMLVNLLDNAIKHTPEGGAVTVGVERQNDEYIIRVTDTGTGIPAAAQPHVFERFYRADPARSRPSSGEGSGAGLGLPIARWIAESHDGRLVLERSDASGSTFVATLPLAVP